jgi:hypothetical protein
MLFIGRCMNPGSGQTLLLRAFWDCFTPIRAIGATPVTTVTATAQGDNGSRGVLHPVTTVNWRDSRVWCNALTEYYNAKHGADTDLDCVYTT